MRSGCFFVNIMNSASHCLGFRVKLVFIITQHTRDIALMQSIRNYPLLDCGNVIVRSNKLACDFQK